MNQLRPRRGFDRLSQDERDRLAELKLPAAGRRAKTSTAYASALTLSDHRCGAAGRETAGGAPARALTSTLELLRAECELLTGEMTAAAERLNVLSITCRRNRRWTRLGGSACTSGMYTTLDQHAVARLPLGLDYLRHLGYEWSPHPTDEEVRREYERIWSKLGSRAIERLIDLPRMTDPMHPSPRWTSRRTSAASRHSRLWNAKLFHAVAICRAANLSLE